MTYNAIIFQRDPPNFAINNNNYHKWKGDLSKQTYKTLVFDSFARSLEFKPRIKPNHPLDPRPMDNLTILRFSL